MSKLKSNPILRLDSYKLSHPGIYAPESEGFHSSIVARTAGKDQMVLFGIKMFIEDVLSEQITYEHVLEAQGFAKDHGESFDIEGWIRIVEVYNGYIPAVIMALPEGLPVPSGNAMVTITVEDPLLKHIGQTIETALVRAVWYPTTIATLGRKIKQLIKHYYVETGVDPFLANFALHDFGGRGVTCSEQAQIGGAAHLVNFMGSDTIEGIRAANFYYNSKMAAFSVPATEHSIQTSYGPDRQWEYLETTLRKLGKKGGIVSVVIDGYDTLGFVDMACNPFFVALVREVGCKLVLRPDSGDPLTLLPLIISKLSDAYGYEVNPIGYSQLTDVGILLGDGVDYDLIGQILQMLKRCCWAANTVIFGSGGALLQKVNRNTFKFAQKANAMLVDGTWAGIKKDPITDPGKASQAGFLTTLRSRVIPSSYITADNSKPISDEWENIMECVWFNGPVENLTTLDMVRERAAQ